MRTCLLLLVTWMTCHLAAVDVSVGDTVLKIPADEHQRELGQDSAFLGAIRGALPEGIRVLYAEAPADEALKTNAGAAARISTCHLLMSLDDLADESYTREDFIATRQDLVDGLKEGLEGSTMTETLELMRRTFALKTQAELAIDSPTLVGEPEVTDDHMHFTMLMAVTVNGHKVMQAIRGTMRPIRNKLVILYSYQEITGEDAIDRVSGTHATFVDRLVRANSLVLPGDEAPLPVADETVDTKTGPAQPTTPTRPAPAKPTAEPALIP